MTDNEKEIQTAAKNMVERYGDNALREVDLRVLELESRNQQEALRLWREIRKRVELLVDTSTGNTKH
jgi:Asp/Glu/hydantoin racemase